MTKFFWIAVKLIVASLPFFLMCFLASRANLKKPQRAKQYPMPAIALVYVLLTMILINKINDWILAAIDLCGKAASALAAIRWMPRLLVDFFKWASDMFHAGYDASVNNIWIFFVANAVIFMVFLILKRICVALFKKFIRTNGGGFQRFAAPLYVYSEEADGWCLRDSHMQTRRLLQLLYIGALVVSCLLLLVSRELYFRKFYSTIFYPVFGIILIGELFFFLNGETLRERTNSVRGESDRAMRRVNYSLVRKYLRSLFGDKVVAEDTSFNDGHRSELTNEAVLQRLLDSRDEKVVSFATYFDALRRKGFDINQNYLYSALDLLEGKSILFNDPFYYDLIPYAFYAINRVLLHHEKVLVVLGRHAIEEDVTAWLQKGVASVTNLPFMWRIRVLDQERAEADIGILTRSQVLNHDVHNTNEEFLNQVGFVVIIEPSKLISTAQIGLNMIVKKCQNYRERKITYCLCDKNCDGLVDAMSHTLLTSITEVAATEKQTGASSYMAWAPDDDYLQHRLLPNISRYLGVGTELSFAALKNQVAKTWWYGGETFPVTDINWVDKQYYFDLMRYADLPDSQDIMDDSFVTVANLWSAQRRKNGYITVEDEFCNLFEMIRVFSTRSSEQGFVNVISSDYLLRDYMAENNTIFETDSKAIPYIVADFVRSNRNMILKMVLMMSSYPTDETLLIKELSLQNIPVFDVKAQIWYEMYRCYSDLEALHALPERYEDAVAACVSLPIRFGPNGQREVFCDIIHINEFFDVASGKTVRMYAIKDEQFLAHFVAELRSAAFLTEDEKGEHYYFGAELAGQIYQRYLPGQFFTFDGKYYEMMSMTSDGHVLVRRAADHINERQTYRQIRKYQLRNLEPVVRIGAQKDVSGMHFRWMAADMRVETPGYYQMHRYHDFKTAKRVLFDSESGGIPERSYQSKHVFCIDLPEEDGVLNDNIRRTITILLNELFRTTFAENQAFVCALTDLGADASMDDAIPLTYTIDVPAESQTANRIYIVEDSQLDLGLLEAVERNLPRFLSIITDYIAWHREAMEKSLNPPPPPAPVPFTDLLPPPTPDDANRSIIERVRAFFRRRKDPKQKKGTGDPVVPVAPIVPVTPPIAPVTPEEPPVEPVTPEEPPVEPVTPEEPPIEPVAPEEPPVEPVETEEPPVEPVTPEEPPVEPVEPEEPPIEPVEPEELPIEPVTPEEPPIAPVEPEEPPVEPVTPEEPPVESIEPEALPIEPVEPEEPIIDAAMPEELPVETIETNALPISPEEPPIAPAAETNPETDPSDGENTTEDSDPSGGEDLANMPPEEEEPVADDQTTDQDAPVGTGANQGNDLSKREPYHLRYYTRFGFETEPVCIDLPGTYRYLSKLGFARNQMQQAREGKKLSDYLASRFEPNKQNLRYCDFCGAEIVGVEYETLADGRDRCMNCSRTAVKTEAEFVQILNDVKRNMEAFFSIKLPLGVRIEMINADELHRRLKTSLVRSKYPDARVLGVAISDKEGYKLYVENGSPRMMTIMTLAHELTHIWQYENWNEKHIKKLYGKKMRLEIYEGMAKWVEVQYAYLLHETAVAKRAEIENMERDDHYGHGFIRYRANYPFSTGMIMTGFTPFTNPACPLDPRFCIPLEQMFILPYKEDAPEPSPETNASAASGQTDLRNDYFGNGLKGARQRDPDNVPHYAYSLLTDPEKELYDKILNAIENYLPDLDVESYGLNEEQITRIYRFVQYDHPEIYWITYFSYHTMGDVVVRISFPYCLTPEEVESRQAEIDEAISAFLGFITDEMSDFEVVLRVYENIIKLIDYDTIGLDKQKKLRDNGEEGNVPDDLRSIYGVFVKKAAVCAGYAKAVQYLLNALGIECAYYSNGEHAWNIVNLEGAYYHLDATWGDSSNTKPEENGEQGVSYDCFCLTTEEILRLSSHDLNDAYPAPICNSVACNYYVRFGLSLDQYDFNHARDIVLSMLSHGASSITLKAQSDEVYQAMKADLLDQHRFREILQFANLKTDKHVDESFRYYEKDQLRSLRFLVSILN